MQVTSPSDAPSQRESEPRRVLLLGATGLIGSAVLARLSAKGIHVRAVARATGPPQRRVEWRALDVGKLTSPEDWAPLLAGVQSVINCAGALQGRDLQAVHVDGLRALLEACEESGVRRIVHLSAIGAERESLTAFSATKKAGEELLRQSRLDWVILRPSVVVGRAAYGGSALLRGLAALPVTLEFPNAGSLQVVQLEDVVATIELFARLDAPSKVAFDVAGPDRLPFTDVVATYRRWLRFGQARRWRLPRWLAALGYRVGDIVRALGWRAPIGTVSRAEIARGAIGDPTEWRKLTGLMPEPLAAALAREPASVQERWFARMYFLKGVVFAVLVAFWVATGLISLGPGWEIGLSYLREGGVPEALARVGVVAGAIADILIGVGIAMRSTSRVALYAAVAISVLYMVAGTFVLPRLWIDPVGPMLKIWPILALNLVALAIVDDR